MWIAISRGDQQQGHPVSQMSYCTGVTAHAFVCDVRCACVCGRAILYYTVTSSGHQQRNFDEAITSRLAPETLELIAGAPAGTKKAIAQQAVVTLSAPRGPAKL